jgi:cellulose synthase (UDP-forming)
VTEVLWDVSQFAGLKFWLTLSVFTVAIMCEALVVVHLFINLLFSWLGSMHYTVPVTEPLSNKPPKVAVLIPSCDEPPAVLERSLSSASRLVYPNMRLLLLENSRNQKLKVQCHAVAARFGVEAVDIPNRGHKAGVLNDAETLLDADTEYLAVLDADQSVEPNFLSDLVPILERDKGLAFVQPPQMYANSESSLLMRAATQQQMLLYDCVLEGKSVYEKAPCVGTNFVMRRAALQEVGGWDETTATEDLTTSYYIHSKGWRSVYSRKCYATGLAPPNLSAYWKQQKRWALGNTSLVRILLSQFLQRGRRSAFSLLTFDYLWSAGFYLTTVAISILATWPTILLVTDLLTDGNVLGIVSTSGSSRLSSMGWAYLSLYPFYVVIMFFPYVNMRLRGYPLRNLVLVQGLVMITAPVVLKSIKRALFGTSKVHFVTSPKTAEPERGSLLAPQTIVFLALLITGSVIGRHVWADPQNFLTWILLLWIFVHTVSLSHFFIYLLESRRMSKNV